MDFFKERVGFKFLCGVWAKLVFFLLFRDRCTSVPQNAAQMNKQL